MNKPILIIILISIYTICPHTIFSQNADNKQWFISTSYGGQISGIKPEDFTKSNLTPAIQINTGLWFTPEIALQFGYKGKYFNLISDNDNHYYNFIYGEVMLNLNELINISFSNKNTWSLIFHPGAGYFYNKYYNRPNVCGNVGLMNYIRKSHKLSIFLDVSAIVGWDIYQGNDDILPSCVLGLVYSI